MPGATVATVLSPLALAAPGDLDPGFADLGRLGPILDGPAWTLDPLDDDSFYMAGGDEGNCGWYCYYYYYTPTNFIGLVSDLGAIVESFHPDSVTRSQVFDLARQIDGGIVVVGRELDRYLTRSQVVVYRLQPDGHMDTSFGADGLFELSIAEHGFNQSATSVVLDPDGRIVVAGFQGDRLLVFRLLPDGSIDDSFGTFGFYAGPVTVDSASARATLLRTAAGGYRVTASTAAGCQIVALTAAGAVDPAFGAAGIATVDALAGPSTACSALVSLADGRLLVAGSADEQGFAVRLLEDGQPDPAFAASAVSAAMDNATALALDDNGAVVVAGTGISGATIMRLLANGDLDALFGKAGSTIVDIPSAYGASPVVHDMSVRPGGRVLAAGGDDRARKAFVVRLLGANGGGSPGVLGVVQQNVIQTEEGAAEVVLNVRRTGGSAGGVSVAYQTEQWDASPGLDYGIVTGRLSWEDGDTADQEIRVPIVADDAGERAETFAVALSDAQGGAGLGTRNAIIGIQADGAPHGLFSIYADRSTVGEQGTVRLTVYREYYSTGEVSVTLMPIAGSASAGSDFPENTTTLTWADGQNDARNVPITIPDDSLAEPAETFTVVLANATGGAMIGPESTVGITIAASDQPLPDKKKKGGGALGYLSLLLLGLTGLLRLMRVRFRARIAGRA